LLPYSKLVDISNVALFAQYIPTCIAVIVLRKRMPNAARTYTLPGGPLIPLLAAGTSVLLLIAARPRLAEWLVSLVVLAVGAVVWALTAALSRRTLKPAGAGNGGT
jgi:amino acid transporter